MKFLLVGHAGAYNRGCEAIVRTTLIMLRKEFGNPEIAISASDYANEESVDYGPDIKIVPSRSKDMWKRFSRDWIVRQFYRVLRIDKNEELWYSPVIHSLKNVNAVLSIGGDNYTLDYNSIDHFLKLNKLVKKFKKKLIIWGASVGPFPQGNKLGKIIGGIKIADLITVREKNSYEYLRNLGITENVKLVADPAFLLPTMNSPSIDKFISEIPKPILGFNISPILEDFTDNINNHEIIEGCISFLRNVMDTMNLHILLIPHVTKKDDSNNDYDFMETIYEKLAYTRMITKVSSDYNAMEIKYAISKCRFFIGARTHSTIAALSSGVPTLSIGYSLKSKGINEDIFGCCDYLLDIKDFSDENLFHKFTNVYTNELKIRDILSKEIPAAKERAWSNIEYLKEIL